MTSPTITQPAAQLLALLQAHPHRRILVGIVGLPGSGKSTIAAQLATEVNAQAGAGTVQALGMDGFHLSRAALAQMPDPAAALARRGAPWTFDPASLAARISALRQASLQLGAAPVLWPEFEHSVGDPQEDAVAIGPATRLVLVEGLYLLHRDHGWNLDGLLDACWYLDVPMEVAMQRLVARHQAAWGFTVAQAEARLVLNDRLNADTVALTRGRADGLLPNV
ncbi:nucleoside/nucleotide kinase family protein [Rhodoferax sp.]|uniref:nucleoside/nucleotide kinase family protein n=1 Tax=Rhodoferax sp. TaxID=50421 RepID=UPI0025FCAC63|nr:nucleoside/nucleotide kinase family protein [Rhodoferax sp.]